MARHFMQAVLLAGLAVSAPVAMGQAPKGQGADPQSAMDRVAMCEGCHGIPGYRTAFPEVYHVPKIAGQQPAYLINALKAYQSGERSHPSMRAIAAALTEQDMAALAAYYGGAEK
jgi:cytochrome c553